MHVCYNFIYYTLLTTLPTYFSTILNFDLHQVSEIFILSRNSFIIDLIKNGFVSAMPYFAQFLSTVIVGIIVDYLRVHKILSITILRKVQTIIGENETVE